MASSLYRLRQAHFQWIQPQRTRDIAHQGFNQDHTLRPAKAAKGCVALGIES